MLTCTCVGGSAILTLLLVLREAAECVLPA